MNNFEELVDLANENMYKEVKESRRTRCGSYLKSLRLSL